MKFKLLLLLVFALAVYLRVDAYLINNSFFTDEILLAANIFEREGWGFLYPLSYHQSAPIGFMMLSKFFVTKTGISELYFRFIPFISSILSVVFFYLLSKAVFKNKYCTLLSLLVFGLSYQLIFYSKYVKTSTYLIDYWHKGFELFKPEIYKINFDFLFYDYAFGLILIVLLICGFYFLFKRAGFISGHYS